MQSDIPETEPQRHKNSCGIIYLTAALKRFGSLLSGIGGLWQIVRPITALLHFVVSLPSWVEDVRVWHDDWLPAMDNPISIIASLFVGLLLLSLSWRLKKSADKDQSERKRKLIAGWREMLARVTAWRDQNESATVEDVIEYAEKRSEFRSLRNYLGSYPPSNVRMLSVTKTGSEIDWLVWIERSIDSLENQWGLVFKHKKTDR